jgi:hypothetical protein
VACQGEWFEVPRTQYCTPLENHVNSMVFHGVATNLITWRFIGYESCGQSHKKSCISAPALFSGNAGVFVAQRRACKTLLTWICFGTLNHLTHSIWNAWRSFAVDGRYCFLFQFIFGAEKAFFGAAFGGASSKSWKTPVRPVGIPLELS